MCVRLIFSSQWPDVGTLPSYWGASSALWRSLFLLDATDAASLKLPHSCAVRIFTRVWGMRMSIVLWDLDSVSPPLKISCVTGSTGSSWPDREEVIHHCSCLAAVQCDWCSCAFAAQSILLSIKSDFGTRREHMKYTFNCTFLSSVTVLVHMPQELYSCFPFVIRNMFFFFTKHVLSISVTWCNVVLS